MNDRIKRLLNKMEAGSLAVFFSGTPAVKSADQYLPFQVNKNFFYLTGLSLPNQALVLIKGNEEAVYLFAETRLKERVKWEGNLPSFDTLKTKTGIAHVMDQTRLDEHINDWLSTDRRAIFGKIEHVYVDLSLSDRRVSPDVLFTQSLKSLYPDINIINSAHHLRAMRTLKDPSEIKTIQQAIHITKDAIQVLMQKLSNTLDEHQLHASFKYEIDKKGAKEAFDTICASGAHAVILHYVENDDVISKEDLVLFDLGASVGEYNADISRTLPASGKFTQRQKELYQLVLDVQEDIIAWIKPGLTFKAFKDKGRDLLAKKAMDIGLIKQEEDIINYYYHGLGHHLGLDVHDPCDYDMVLTPGMIITIEPGIYVAEEGIGIRIEDDVLITKDGCQNLSKDIPKQIAEIESLMSKETKTSYHKVGGFFMKFFLNLILCVVLTTVFTIDNQASYPNFESITIIDGNRLEAFSSDDYTHYYKEVKRRKMFGWQIHYVHDRIDISYVKETLFSYYNDGYTAIEYDYQMEYTSSSTFQIQATGTIGYTTKDDARSFKNKLDASLKISSDYKSSRTTNESVDIHIKVDPGTQVDLYIYGEGYITNGVAARYFFWMRRNIGGFEWFEKTTEYQRLEKFKI